MRNEGPVQPAPTRGRVKLLLHVALEPRTMTCEPSSLISVIHRNLPYFTSNAFQGVNLTNVTITVENILEDVLVLIVTYSQYNNN